MRKINSMLPLIAVMIVGSSGCRQTTGPMSAGSLSTASPLSPVAPGQAPSLGLFGAPTRVAPPPTGSFVQPNAYLNPITQPQAQHGGPAPAASFGQSPGTSFGQTASVAPSFQPIGGQTTDSLIIGSGVQTASWTETNSNIPNAVADPRSGGMQVIDLTGAPSPPGYRSPVVPNYGYQAGGYPGGSNFQPPYAPAFNPEQGSASNWQAPVPQNYQPQFAAPQPYLPQTNAPQPQDYSAPPMNAFVPDPGRIASAGLTPLPTPTQSASMPMRTQSNFQNSNAPSTAPAAPSNLPWRRPGTQN